MMMMMFNNLSREEWISLFGFYSFIETADTPEIVNEQYREVIVTQILHSLKQVLAWIFLGIILITGLGLINEYHHIIPLAYFIALWGIHFICWLICIQSIRVLIRIILCIQDIRNSEEALIHEGVYENDYGMGLIIYTLIRYVVILLIHVPIIIWEVLFFLDTSRSHYGGVAVVPLLMLATIGLLFGLLCKGELLIFWVSFTAFCILLNLKLSFELLLSWTIVLIPLFIIVFHSIIGVLIFWWHTLRQFYRLQKSQVWSLILLTISLFSFTIIMILYLKNVEYSNWTAPHMPVYFSILLISELTFALGVLVSLDYSLSSKTARLGAIRPKPLVQRSSGGWDLNRQEYYFDSAFFGEVEVSIPPERRLPCFRRMMDPQSPQARRKYRYYAGSTSHVGGNTSLTSFEQAEPDSVSQDI